MSFEHSTINQAELTTAVEDPKAVFFLLVVLMQNYEQFFVLNQDESKLFLVQVLHLLVQTYKLSGPSTQFLEQVKTLVGSNDWFVQGYKHYKETIKPELELDRIMPHIRGNRILDFGSGGSHLSALLAQKYQVICTDIFDHRTGVVRKLPFYQMEAADDVPFLAEPVDTTIIKTVLHHIPEDLIPKILQRLKQESKRLIIIEDISDFPTDDPQVQELLTSDPKFADLKELDLATRHRINVLTDTVGNATSGNDVVLPFSFQSHNRWLELLQQAGFSNIEYHVSGFVPHHLHGFAQEIIVADV